MKKACAEDASGRYNDPGTCTRLVRTNNPKGYKPSRLSPGGSLLCCFWLHAGHGEAVRHLAHASVPHVWRWVIQPGEDGYDTLDAFRIACAHRVGRPMSDRMIRGPWG